MKASKRTTPPRHLPNWLWILAPIIFYVLVCVVQPSKTTKPTAPTVVQPVQQQALKQNLPYTIITAEPMLRALMADMHWENPKNSYFPVFAREQFKKFSLANQAGQIKIFVDTRSYDPNADTEFHSFAQASYRTNRMPTMEFLLQPLVNETLEDYQAGRPFKRLTKNKMYYFIAHEMLHLDQPASAFLVEQSREYHIQEEMRVWAICNFKIIRPLRELKSKEEIFTDFWDADTIMLACHDDWQGCPAWRKFIEDRI